MRDFEDDFRWLAEEAQKINDEYWTQTGNNLDPLNAMLAILAGKVRGKETNQSQSHET